MLKNILSLGTVLNKVEQQSVRGGGNGVCCQESCNGEYCLYYAPSYTLCPDMEPHCF